MPFSPATFSSLRLGTKKTGAEFNQDLGFSGKGKEHESCEYVQFLVCPERVSI